MDGGRAGCDDNGVSAIAGNGACAAGDSNGLAGTGDFLTLTPTLFRGVGLTFQALPARAVLD